MNSDGMNEAEFFVQNRGRHLVQTKSTDDWWRESFSIRVRLCVMLASWLRLRNFEKAKLTSDLAKIKHEETRKIQQARRLLEKKMTKCDNKSRESDSRIKASSLFGDGHDSLAALESALEESHNDSKSLRDRVKVLEATLKDIVSNGVNHDPLKGKGIMVRIKSEPSSSPPNPARSSSSASGYSSSSSAT